jgi:hypothetical protein
MALRQVDVNHGFAQVGVAEQQLDGAQVGSGFEEMSGEAVAQGLLILLMICTQQRFAIGVIPSVA